MSIRGVLFDIDDTLLDTRTAFAAAVRAVAERFLPHVPAERHEDVLAVWRRDDGGHFRAYTRGEVDFRAQRRARAGDLQRAFGGRELDDVSFETWDLTFESTVRDCWRAHADAPAAVEDVARRGLAFGSLSNSHVAYQVDKLALAGLGHVPMLVGIDTLGVGKPAPEVFREACNRLGVAPGEALYVGDELDVDAHGAAAAGLTGVWLDRPGARRGGAFVEDRAAAESAGIQVITALSDLARLLGESLGEPGQW